VSGLNGSNFADIPFMNSAASEDGHVTKNHTVENLARGLGDICKLAGLSPDDARRHIAAGTLGDYDGGFRLPTANENDAFLDPYTFRHTTLSGGGGRWLGSPSNFLPYAGYYDAAGPSSGRFTGYYWTSRSENLKGGALSFDSEPTSVGNKSIDQGCGLAVRCVATRKHNAPPPPTRVAGGADLICLDDDGRLALGQWDDEITKENYAHKLLFFQFGSVVGFAPTEDWNNATSIKFNPTSTPEYAYDAIPNYSYPVTAWRGSTPTSPSASDYDYHNAFNVLNGRGDPCKLVGLSAAEVRQYAMNGKLDGYDNGGWRLPTALENALFVGGPLADKGSAVTYKYGTQNDGTYYDYYVDGSTTDGTLACGRFPVEARGNTAAFSQKLPVTGRRGGSYGAMMLKDNGNYWSSTPASNTFASFLSFDKSTLTPVGISNPFNNGYPIRCVRDGGPTPEM
jgi:hypothetical protein